MVPRDRAAEVLAQQQGNLGASQLMSDSQEALPLSPRRETPKAGGGSDTPGSGSGAGSVEEAIRLAVDQDLEQLVNLKEREDVEEIYGVPVIVSHSSPLHISSADFMIYPVL